MLSHFSPVWLFATLWTVVYQVPLSMGFFQQEYWSGPPFPPPGDRPNPGMEPTSLASPALADRFFTTSATWEAQSNLWRTVKLFLQWLYQFTFPLEVSIILYPLALYFNYLIILSKMSLASTKQKINFTKFNVNCFFDILKPNYGSSIS